jgi:hypothetical protein
MFLLIWITQSISDAASASTRDRRQVSANRRDSSPLIKPHNSFRVANGMTGAKVISDWVNTQFITYDIFLAFSASVPSSKKAALDNSTEAAHENAQRRDNFFASR